MRTEKPQSVTKAGAEDAWSQRMWLLLCPGNCKELYWEQQLIAGRGGGGNIKGAPSCLGTPCSQSRSSDRYRVGLERNKIVLKKRQDMSITTRQTSASNDVWLRNSKLKWSLPLTRWIWVTARASSTNSLLLSMCLQTAWGGTGWP